MVGIVHVSKPVSILTYAPKACECGAWHCTWNTFEASAAVSRPVWMTKALHYRENTNKEEYKLANI
mgnify:CR=1 FL=1